MARQASGHSTGTLKPFLNTNCVLIQTCFTALFHGCPYLYIKHACHSCQSGTWPHQTSPMSSPTSDGRVASGQVCLLGLHQFQALPIGPGATDPAAEFGAGGSGRKSNSTAGSILQDLFFPASCLVSPAPPLRLLRNCVFGAELCPSLGRQD